jgi:hypothetical protein
MAAPKDKYFRDGTKLVTGTLLATFQKNDYTYPVSSYIRWFERLIHAQILDFGPLYTM